MAWSNSKRQTPHLPTGFHSTVDVDNVASIQEPSTICYYDYNQKQRGPSGGRNYSSGGYKIGSPTQQQHSRPPPPAPNSASKHTNKRLQGGGFQTVAVQAPGCQVQHFRICVGNDPDDVAAWIKERKRKFPRQKKLTDLLGAYGDSSDEDELDESLKHVDEKKQLHKNETNKVPDIETSVRSTKRIGETTTSSSPNKRRRLCRYFANGTCKSGDKCPFSHENKPSSNRLVDKLLEQERKREAALTLQLLFLLHNEFNYFQDIDHQS